MLVKYIWGKIVNTISLSKKKKWENKDLGIIMLASILPFGTFYIDWKYLKN
jgi:hypothetical protein